MKTPRESRTKEAKRQFCAFALGDRMFCVDIMDVREISAETEFTPIFHAPKGVKGYVNIRGQVYLILDLRAIMGLESGRVNENSRVILFKQNVDDSFGALVDRVGDVIEADEDGIEEYEKEEQTGPDPISGVCKLEGRLLVILNAAELLDTVGRKGHMA